ncbi:MAG: hypothetical protein FJ100_07290 [Deltaproteobacteria bacterium]|nr:hypothetical protein [Deltaproteobacteria bacterium]
MGRCCGGKNAGKPISRGRYAVGLGVFCGYHGAVGALLHAAAIPVPALRKVRDFHRSIASTELKEILALRDINLNGESPADAEAGVCDLDPPAADVADSAPSRG